MKLTVGQALVKYLSRQYCVHDGERQRLIPATLGIFGHGNVAGLGQALDQYQSEMPFIQGRNEQSLVHMASAFARAHRRRATLAVTSSIRRDQHGHRCGNGHDQPDPGAPAPR